MSSYQKHDHHFHRAKREGFVARSVYKLEEMDRRFGLIRRGDRIVDLGAAPGSWSQYASNAVGPQGSLIGIDLERIDLSLPNAEFKQIGIQEWLESIGATHEHTAPPELRVNVVLSDMAPKTTGIRATDQARSMALCELALYAARRILLPGGRFVCKLFEGAGVQEFRKGLRTSFERLETLRPDATRSRSIEVYLIGIGFKN